MTKKEIHEMLMTMQTAYPRFYVNQTKEQLIGAINLWFDMFKDDDATLVAIAVKQLIATLQYPPTVADVKNTMYKMTTQNEVSPSELWSCIQKAIRNSGYYAREEFEKLPDICKKYVGSPAQLREWAISPDYNNGVQQSLFLKQVEILKQREKDNAMLLPETRTMIAQLTDGFDMKLLN